MTQVAYRELAPPARWRDRVSCMWERPAGHVGTVLVLPDGCADVVWSSDGALFIAGPDLGPVEHALSEDVTLIGVRLRPGTAGTSLAQALDDLRDRRVPLEELWGREASWLGERMAAATSASDRMRVLAAAVGERVVQRPVDTDVASVAGELARGGLRVGDLAAATGGSERQFRRRFIAQVGYGPKTFDRVMRLQRFLALGRDRRAGAGVASLAAAAGYADQSHLTRDCRDLTGRTPGQLLAAHRLESTGVRFVQS
jgi:AraC-like DNA-binding protein